MTTQTQMTPGADPAGLTTLPTFNLRFSPSCVNLRHFDSKSTAKADRQIGGSVLLNLERECVINGSAEDKAGNISFCMS